MLTVLVIFLAWIIILAWLWFSIILYSFERISIHIGGIKTFKTKIHSAIHVNYHKVHFLLHFTTQISMFTSLLIKDGSTIDIQVEYSMKYIVPRAWELVTSRSIESGHDNFRLGNVAGRGERWRHQRDRGVARAEVRIATVILWWFLVSFLQFMNLLTNICMQIATENILWNGHKLTIFFFKIFITIKFLSVT